MARVVDVVQATRGERTRGSRNDPHPRGQGNPLLSIPRDIGCRVRNLQPVLTERLTDAGDKFLRSFPRGRASRCTGRPYQGHAAAHVIGDRAPSVGNRSATRSEARPGMARLFLYGRLASRSMDRSRHSSGGVRQSVTDGSPESVSVTATGHLLKRWPSPPGRCAVSGARS